MPSASSNRALRLLTLLLSASAALAQNPPPPPHPPQQPYQGLPIRIGTWNIHPTNVGTQTPDDRLRDVVNFARNNNVDILALQEVPQALLNDAARMAAFSNVVQAQGYGMLTAAEYPSGTRAPTATRQNAYVVLYNLTHITPVPAPAALTFYQEDRFVQGIAQARPPVQIQFHVHHPNNHADTTLNFLTWHNEAGTMARPHMAELSNLIQRDLQARSNNNNEDFAVVGDFNVQETVPEIRRLDARNRLAHDQGIDHIVVNRLLTNVINDNTTNPIDPQFRSQGRHLILFAEFPVGKQ